MGIHCFTEGRDSLEEFVKKMLGDKRCVSRKEVLADKSSREHTMIELKGLYRENRPNRVLVRDAIFYDKGLTKEGYAIGIRYY